MKISIHTIPNAKKQSIEKDIEIEYHYKIHLTNPAKEGKANKELIKLLANYFNISKSRITIQKGLKSHHKIIKLNI